MLRPLRATMRDLPGVDMIFVPAGGGGLISGVAACAKQINPRIQIIGVQAEGAPAIANSFRTGERTPSDTVHTIADGIAVKTPGEKTFEYIKQYVDRVVTVSDAPGALEHFSHIVAQQNANIILFQHDRVQTDLEIGEAIIHVVCEVGGVDHAKRLIDTLTDDGYKVFTSQI